jgi:hypothetical protein
MANIKFYPFDKTTKVFALDPIPASKMVPEWYKKQLSSGSDEKTISKGFIPSTIKKCMPVFDLMTSGYLLLSPCDIYLDASDPNELKYTVPDGIKDVTKNIFASHNREQYSELPYDREYYHKDIFRINPFWSVSTPSGYSTMFINPMYKDETPIDAVSAIVDTDKYISNGHLSFYVRNGYRGIIKQGTPLIQVIPFKRDSWEMSIEDAETSIELADNQFFKIRSTFTNGYKNIMRSKKEYK